MSRPDDGIKDEDTTDIYVADNSPQKALLTGDLARIGKVVKSKQDKATRATRVTAYDTSGEAIADKRK